MKGMRFFAQAIKPGNNRDTLAANRREPMLRNPNARLARKRQCECFNRRDVPRAV